MVSFFWSPLIEETDATAMNAAKTRGEIFAMDTSIPAPL